MQTAALSIAPGSSLPAAVPTAQAGAAGFAPLLAAQPTGGLAAAMVAGVPATPGEVKPAAGFPGAVSQEQPRTSLSQLLASTALPQPAGSGAETPAVAEESGLANSLALPTEEPIAEAPQLPEMEASIAENAPTGLPADRTAELLLPVGQQPALTVAPRTELNPAVQMTSAETVAATQGGDAAAVPVLPAQAALSQTQVRRPVQNGTAEASVDEADAGEAGGATTTSPALPFVEPRVPNQSSTPATSPEPLTADNAPAGLSRGPVASHVEAAQLPVDGSAPTTDASDGTFGEALRSADAATPEAARPQTVSTGTPAPVPVATDAARAVPAAYRQADAAAAPARDETEIAARPGALGRNLGVEIARHVRDGDETMRVRLNPVELGRIDVTLSFDEAGSLRATMRAETPAALELLRRDSADLTRALDQAGVRSDAQSFRFEQRSDGQQHGQQGHSGARQLPYRSGGAQDETPGAIADNAYRPIRGIGRVDLLA